MAQELPGVRTPHPPESAGPAPSSPPGPFLPRPLLGVLLVLAAVAYGRLVLWNPDPADLPVGDWFFFGWSRMSPQFVFVLVAAVAFLRRRFAAVAIHDEGSARLALPLLAVATALLLWGAHANAEDIVLLSLIALLLGGALLLSGVRFLRRIALPVALLAFAIPPPGVLSNAIVFPLALWGGRSAAWLLDLAGIPVIREGDLLLLASGDVFKIIDSCSGLRSIEVLTMLAVAWVGVLAVPRWHAVLFVASAPVIAYAMNVLRILSLVLAPQSRFSLMHSIQGTALFLAGIAVLAGVDALLRRLWRSETLDPEGAGTPEPPSEGAAARRRGRAILLSLVLTMLAGVSWLTPRWTAPPPPSRPPLALPEQLAGWTAAEKLPLDGHFLGSVRFSGHWHRRYRRNGEEVSVFVGYDDRLRRDRSLLSGKNGVPGSGWHPESEARIELEPGGLVVHALQARSGTERVLAYHWYEGVASLPGEVLRAALATDQSRLRRAEGGLVVRLSTPVEIGPRGRDLSAARLREVATLLARELARQGSPGAADASLDASARKRSLHSRPGAGAKTGAPGADAEPPARRPPRGSGRPPPQGEPEGFAG